MKKYILIFLIVFLSTIQVYGLETEGYKLVRSGTLDKGYNKLTYIYDKMSMLVKDYRIVIEIKDPKQSPGWSNIHYNFHHLEYEHDHNYKLTAQNPKIVLDPSKIIDFNKVRSLELDEIAFITFLYGSDINYKIYERDKGYIPQETILRTYDIGTGNLEKVLDKILKVNDTNIYDYFIGYTTKLWDGSLNLQIDVDGSSFYTGYYCGDEYVSSDAKSPTLLIPLPEDFSEVHINSTLTPGKSGVRQSSAIRIYKKLKTKSITLKSDFKEIGDNTSVKLEIKLRGFLNPSNETIEIYETLNNTTLYKDKYMEQIHFNIKEGDFNLKAKIVSSSGEVIESRNVIEITKKNILNRTLEQLKNNQGLDKFIIINDKDRYFENNSLNQSIVNEIKNKSKGTFLIYNDVSQVLDTLLERK